MANSCSKRSTTVTCRFMSIAPPRNRFSHCVEYNLLICGHYYARNVAKKELCSCNLAARWAPGNYGLERFPTRNIKHEAASLSTCRAFVERFDKGIPFTNIVDKGYRCIMAAWRVGKQLFLQPAFARSDRKFNTREVNRSSTVASDRSGNERAINVAKRAGVLK